MQLTKYFHLFFHAFISLPLENLLSVCSGFSGCSLAVGVLWGQYQRLQCVRLVLACLLLLFHPASGISGEIVNKCRKIVIYQSVAGIWKKPSKFSCSMRRVLPEAEGILHSFTAISAVGAVRPQGQQICSPGAAALLLSLENDDSLGLVQRLSLVYCLQAMAFTLRWPDWWGIACFPETRCWHHSVVVLLANVTPS